MGDLDNIEKGTVGIEDRTSGSDMLVNPDGSINANINVANTPTEGTQVVQSEFGAVATTSGNDLEYTITDGKMLRIQLFSAGSEEKTGGSIVELFEDPNGDKSVLNRISTLFTNGMSTNVIIRQDFDGDGTRRIVLRRRGYTSNSREMFGEWIGFEE